MMLASQHSFMSSVALVTATPGNRRHLYFTVCVVNMLALCIGIPISFSSPILPKLLTEDRIHENPLGRVITKEEASFIGSLMTVGGFFGTYLAGLSAEKVGRKKSLILSCAVPISMAFLILANARNIILYYIARLLSGVAVSGVYTVIPLYNGEIAETSNRGLICCSMLTFQATGQLFTYCAAPYLTIFTFCIISLAISLSATALIFATLPESPYYLINVNDRSGAEKALIKLRSTIGREISNELNFIQMVVEECKVNHGRMLDMLTVRHLRRAHIMSVMLTVFQNLSGIIAILFYSESIFRESGSEIPPEICAMTIGLVYFLSSFITPGLVDRLGRRCMLFVSACGMSIAHVHLGLYFYLKEKENKDIEAIFWLPIVCMVMYMIFYCIGYGPLVWTVMAEIFPNDMKSTAASITVAWSWGLAFVIAFYFQPAAQWLGIAYCFWFFAGSCLLAAIFSITCVIETKGKSFQEIQELLSK